MATPNEQMDEIDLILDLYRRGVERHYGGRTVGKTLTGEEAAARLKRLVLEGRTKLPKPYTEEQILGMNLVDQEYMRGFNRCLEDIASMNGESLTAELGELGER